MPNNLLITGESGTGKSSALSRVADDLSSLRTAGFLGLRETIVESAESPAWRIDGFNGVSGLLVHTSIKSRHRLGSMGVDMQLFERCVATENAAMSSADIVIIDEIGIIGGWSDRFLRFTEAALDSSTPTVAIVRLKPGDFSDQVKSREDIELWTVTRDNRETIDTNIAHWARALNQTGV
jgi:nucleoside-triphosphatase THEP1